MVISKALERFTYGVLAFWLYVLIRLSIIDFGLKNTIITLAVTTLLVWAAPRWMKSYYNWMEQK
jgi:uncharacterized membrane protein